LARENSFRSVLDIVLGLSKRLYLCIGLTIVSIVTLKWQRTPLPDQLWGKV
jgi:hypothetical protein